jgi:hypothetical protein
MLEQPVLVAVYRKLDIGEVVVVEGEMVGRAVVVVVKEDAVAEYAESQSVGLVVQSGEFAGELSGDFGRRVDAAKADVRIGGLGSGAAEVAERIAVVVGTGRPAAADLGAIAVVIVGLAAVVVGMRNNFVAGQGPASGAERCPSGVTVRSAGGKLGIRRGSERAGSAAGSFGRPAAVERFAVVVAAHLGVARGCNGLPRPVCDSCRCFGCSLWQVGADYIAASRGRSSRIAAEAAGTDGPLAEAAACRGRLAAKKDPSCPRPARLKWVNAGSILASDSTAAGPAIGRSQAIDSRLDGRRSS